jgi:hypothetical protein
VVSPCHLFSRDHDHVVETSRADRHRAPCGNRRIALLVPTSVGWDDRCVRGAVKGRNPPAVLPLPSLACSRIRQSHHPYFFLLASFGRTTTSPPLPCSTHSPSKLVSRLRQPPPEEARGRPKEEPDFIVDHVPDRGDV